MTIQVSNSDSGLFRFIHDCGHPGNLGDFQFELFQYFVKHVNKRWHKMTAQHGSIRRQFSGIR